MYNRIVDPQVVTPIVVQMVDEPTRETNVGDILLGAVGVVGVILVAALVVGLVAGWVFILIHRWRPDNAFNGQTAEESTLKLNSLT